MRALKFFSGWLFGVSLLFTTAVFAAPKISLPLAQEQADQMHFINAANINTIAIEAQDTQHFKIAQPSALNKPHKSPWAGTQVSLGLVINTGNTNTTNVNAGAVINYAKGPWNNNAQATAQWGRDSGVLTKEKYFLQNQLSYLFGKAQRNYGFVNGTGTADEFSPYEYQAIVAAGYGREVFKTDKFNLKLQSGPGFRRNVQKKTTLGPSKVMNGAVLSSEAKLAWQVTKSGQFSEDLRYDYGSPYNYMRSVTAFTNKIIRNIAMQVSLTLDRYSKIPAGSLNTKKLDTTTSLALVYTF